MREVGLSDLDVATRALLRGPPQGWPQEATRLIEQAHCADIWRKRTGSAHPGGGTGSLYAQAVLADPIRERCCSPEYCAALMVVLQTLSHWRARTHDGN